MSITVINTYIVTYIIITNLEAQQAGEVESSPVTTIVHAATDQALAGVLTANLTLASNQTIGIQEFIQVPSDGNVYQ